MQNSKLINELAELVGDYVDLERESYFLFKECLLKKGWTYSYKEIEFIQNNCLCFINKKPFKKDPTFSELLQLETHFVMGAWFERDRVVIPTLFWEEEYEFTIMSNGTELGKLSGKLELLTKRYSDEKRITGNFISSLGQENLELITKNKKLEIKVKLKTESKTREDIEKSSGFLNNTKIIDDFTHSRTYVQKLYRLKPEGIKQTKRLSLFGKIPGRTYKDKINYLNDHNIFCDFGIKDLLHLRYIINNFSDAKISNKELLNPNSVAESRKMHLNFQEKIRKILDS